MRITLQRISEDQYGTHGELRNENGLICYTLEHPWKNNKHDISCIPPGVYGCIPHDTPAHPNVWEITNVPNRQAILIHSGNTLADTKGCVLAGLNKTILGVSSSKAAINKLHTILPDKFEIAILTISK